jgi:hypothetical protein
MMGKVFKKTGRILATPFRKGKQVVVTKTILGVVRHVLTAAGGGLVANGSLTSSDLEAVIGAVITLVGIGWSVYEKRSAAPPAK